MKHVGKAKGDPSGSPSLVSQESVVAGTLILMEQAIVSLSTTHLTGVAGASHAWCARAAGPHGNCRCLSTHSCRRTGNSHIHTHMGNIHTHIHTDNSWRSRHSSHTVRRSHSQIGSGARSRDHGIHDHEIHRHGNHH